MSAQAAVDPLPVELPLLEAKLAKPRLRAGVIPCARLFLGEMPQLETRSGSRSIDEEGDLAPAERHREAEVGGALHSRVLGGWEVLRWPQWPDPSLAYVSRPPTPLASARSVLLPQ